MKKTFLYLFGLSAFLFPACVGTGEWKWEDQNGSLLCYEVMDEVYGADGTILILHLAKGLPELEITDPFGGPSTTILGRLEENVFIYGDGTKLYFDEEKAWYEENEFLKGITAEAVVCAD